MNYDKVKFVAVTSKKRPALFPNLTRSSLYSNQPELANVEAPSQRQNQPYESIVSSDFSDIPIIDIEAYLQFLEHDKNQLDEANPLSDKAKIECQKVAECFHKFGILFIRDPRVDHKDNDNYIDLMEDYFEKTGELFYTGEKVDDIKAEFHYQVGATPENVEMAREHTKMLSELDLPTEDMPGSPSEPVFDAKWRFMWKIGERPEGADDDFPQVVP